MENKQMKIIEAVLEIKLNRKPTEEELKDVFIKMDNTVYFRNTKLGSFATVDFGGKIGKAECFDMELEEIDIEELLDEAISDFSSKLFKNIEDEKEISPLDAWNKIKRQIIEEGVYNTFKLNSKFDGIDDSKFTFLRSVYLNSLEQLFEYIDNQIEKHS